MAAEAAAAVALALAGGWTAAALIDALRRMLPDLFAHGAKESAQASAISAALGALGFREAEEETLDRALTGVVSQAFWDGVEFAGQEVGKQPEDFLVDGGLNEALAKLGIEIKGISRVSVDRIGNTLAEAIREGKSAAQAADMLDPILHDPKRAMVIARTEIARAMEAGLLAQGQAAGGMEKRWMDIEGACVFCRENAAEGPIPLAHPFKAGAMQPPQHPNCRCALALVPAPVLVPA